jgi:hypothetical protein
MLSNAERTLLDEWLARVVSNLETSACPMPREEPAATV